MLIAFTDQARRIDGRTRLLLLLSLVSSSLYLFGQVGQPLPGSLVFKALSIAPLAAMAGLQALISRRRIDYTLLAGALGFSCLGDVLLDLDGERLFVPGLLAFLSAHLIYFVLFLRHRLSLAQFSGAQRLRSAVVLLASLILTGVLMPRLGELQLPVLIYICAITAMVVAAVSARFQQPWVWLGAVLFLVSDSMIALHKFIAPMAARDVLVWTLYYLGQCGIAIGFIREQAKEE